MRILFTDNQYKKKKIVLVFFENLDNEKIYMCWEIPREINKFWGY